MTQILYFNFDLFNFWHLLPPHKRTQCLKHSIQDLLKVCFICMTNNTFLRLCWKDSDQISIPSKYISLIFITSYRNIAHKITYNFILFIGDHLKVCFIFWDYVENSLSKSWSFKNPFLFIKKAHNLISSIKGLLKVCFVFRTQNSFYFVWNSLNKFWSFLNIFFVSFTFYGYSVHHSPVLKTSWKYALFFDPKIYFFKVRFKIPLKYLSF